MINPVKISTQLSGQVGWRQPLNPDYDILDAGNLASRSGYYVNDNPLCKVEYLKDSQDYAAISDAEFNTFLVQKQEAAIVSVCNSVFNGADYIDRQVLYQFVQNKQDTSDLPDGFIGYRIKVAAEKNIAFKISRVLLDFESSTPDDITLQLYNTSVKAPIKSQIITIDADHKAVELNWVIDNSGDYYKGDYYLGYISTGLTVKPFEREFENDSIESIITHLNIWPIKVVGHAANELFDLEDVDGLSEATGVNPDITVYDDFTDLIIQNEHLFSKAVQIELQIACLSEYLSSLRSNRNERRGNDMTAQMLAAMEGQRGEGIVHIEGLRPRLVQEISDIKEQIKRLQSGYFGDGIMVQTLN